MVREASATRARPGSGTLFRPESVESRRDSWLGHPRVVRAMPVTGFAVASLVLALCILAFLVFGQYTRRVPVTGLVLPPDGLTRLAAPQSGWIAEIKVAEGQLVRRGDVLYALRVDSTTSLGDTQGAVASLLRAKRDELQGALARREKLDLAEKQGLTDQAQHLDRELAEMDTQIGILERFADELEVMAQRQQKWLDRGLSRSADYESRLQAYNAQKAQVLALRRERLQAEGRLNEVRTRLASFDLQSLAGRSEIRQQILDLDGRISESEARRELRIEAPREGIVTGISASAGQAVVAGAPLLTIVPAGKPLVAQLLAPSSVIGFPRDGARVLLRYRAFPYQKFGQYPGHIVSVSRANLRPEEVAQIAGGTGSGSGPSFYRVTVVPDEPFVRSYGRTESLQAGMQVDAHLLGETRPLYQWILEPLYGLRAAVAAPPGPAS
ncbi:HlyD family secretion protein [Methylobacterium sp. JK268]